MISGYRGRPFIVNLFPAVNTHTATETGKTRFSSGPISSILKYFF